MTLAMQTVLDDLGKGLGPLVVALMISAWGRCAPGARLRGSPTGPAQVLLAAPARVAWLVPAAA